ncbi:hypothetical protein M975_3241 [Buttiauxella brennerae ATCC 51605]|uniref:Uncharacterized protein n=1 Tax=Buttiauxella brennerae ATCC 51605 TaxID=1354251 RepID=A0A1B7IJQ2_9ENTR|nr:hypothetical protein M975_3241 [Buttiauxella brennerae ATCC 51605]
MNKYKTKNMTQLPLLLFYSSWHSGNELLNLETAKFLTEADDKLPL